MDIINKELLNFFQKGLFQETKTLEGNYKERVEQALFLGGMKRFMSDLKYKLKLELKETYVIIPIKIEPIFDENGIYMFSRSKDFRVFELNSENTHLQTIEALNFNLNEIVENSLIILKREIEEFVHNKELFNQILKDLISEKREEGFFITEYDFYNTTAEKTNFYDYIPSISATYYTEGIYMRAMLLGMRERMIDKRSTGEKHLMQRKKYTEEEVREVLEPVVQTLIQRFNRELKGNVEYNAVKELENKYGLSGKELSRIKFIESERDSFSVTLERIYVPLNVTKGQLAEVVEIAKALDYLDEQSEEIKDILSHLTFGDFLNFNSGKLEINNLSEAKFVVNLLEDELDKVKEIIKKDYIGDIQLQYPYFGKSFFLTAKIPFEYKGNQFERISYRLPGSKKTRSIMYENGKRISANRYFKTLRKYNKQK